MSKIVYNDIVRIAPPFGFAMMRSMLHHYDGVAGSNPDCHFHNPAVINATMIYFIVYRFMLITAVPSLFTLLKKI
jgi:hypothetical protein